MYISKIRRKIGNDLLIHPAVRIIIENERGEYLFIQRVDNGQYGIPAGAMEEGESIEDCAKREVLEETGLEILNLDVIGIGSHPQKEQVVYPNGDVTQYCTIEFYSKDWKGQLRADELETKQVFFKPKEFIQELPTNELACFESLAYYREKGKIRLH